RVGRLVVAKNIDVVVVIVAGMAVPTHFPLVRRKAPVRVLSQEAGECAKSIGDIKRIWIEERRKRHDGRSLCSAGSFPRSRADSGPGPTRTGQARILRIVLLTPPRIQRQAVRVDVFPGKVVRRSLGLGSRTVMDVQSDPSRAAVRVERTLACSPIVMVLIA